MTKQELKQEVSDIVRSTLRKEGYYSENSDVLLSIGDVIDSIYLDRTYIMNDIRKALSEGCNPLNAILGLFGLRIVSPERTMRVIGSALGETPPAGIIVEEIDSTASLKTFLRIDKDKVTEAVERMALVLRDKAVSDNRTIDSIRDQMELSQSEMERTGTELQQLRTDHQETIRLVVAWAQRILVPDSADPISGIVLSLLEDMDISVHWDTENVGLSHTAMFTTLRRAPSYQGRNQPCLVKDGQVLLKGLVLIDE